MFSVMLGAGLGLSKGDRVPQERVVEAQGAGGECCPRYDLKVHLPAEEWSPTSFVRQIQWKNTAGVGSLVPIHFSVEYCAGINLEGPCSSFNGEITIDGVLQELGGSNGGTDSWPFPYCGSGQGVCGHAPNTHPCKLVELEESSEVTNLAGGGCGYENPLEAQLPCFADTDHRLTIAEKIFQGQTKRFRRIFLYQDPGSDPSTGNPPRLIQRSDPPDPNQDPPLVLCGPSIDQYFLIARPWLAIYEYQFGQVTSSSEECWDPECHLEADVCFGYRFYPLLP